MAASIHTYAHAYKYAGIQRVSVQHSTPKTYSKPFKPLTQNLITFKKLNSAT